MYCELSTRRRRTSGTDEVRDDAPWDVRLSTRLAFWQQQRDAVGAVLTVDVRPRMVERHVGWSIVGRIRWRIHDDHAKLTVRSVALLLTTIVVDRRARQEEEGLRLIGEEGRGPVAL